jgi:hypothetical protein
MTRCKEVRTDNDHIHIELEDGRILSTPLSWYPALLSATESKRKSYRLIARKTMIEWEDLDIHLDIEEMFRIETREEAA